MVGKQRAEALMERVHASDEEVGMMLGSVLRVAGELFVMQARLALTSTMRLVRPSFFPLPEAAAISDGW